MKQFLFAISLFLSIPALCQDDVAVVGQRMPDFTIQSSKGPVSAASLKGKIVLINFFATWCVPCIQELPVLQKEVWEKYRNNPKFVLLVIGRDHTAEEVNNFKTQRGFDLPMYPDTGKHVYLQFANRLIPRNYLINEKGEIVYTSMGYEPEEFKELLRKLKALLQ